MAGTWFSGHVSPTVPGRWATCSPKVARTGINVLDVAHVRAAAGLGFGEAEVEIRAQAQGRQHADTAVEQLRREGSITTVP
jgi:hypothetical protein